MAPSRARSSAAALLFLSASLGLNAVTVGLSPAEEGSFGELGRETPMRFLVSGCLDRLFDAGFIATDSSVRPSSLAEWGKAEIDESALRDAFVDFDIRLYVEWKESSYKLEALLPSRIAFRLVRVSDGSIVSEGSVDGPPDSEDAAMHHEAEAAKAGAAGIASCIELLRTLAKGDRL